MAIIVFDDMIADMFSNKKCNPILTDLFIRRRNLNISIALLHNLTHYFIMKISSKWELQ